MRLEKRTGDVSGKFIFIQVLRAITDLNPTHYYQVELVHVLFVS